MDRVIDPNNLNPKLFPLKVPINRALDNTVEALRVLDEVLK